MKKFLSLYHVDRKNNLFVRLSYCGYFGFAVKFFVFWSAIYVFFYYF